MLKQTLFHQDNPDQNIAVNLFTGGIWNLIPFADSCTPEFEIVDNTLVLVDGHSIAKSILKSICPPNDGDKSTIDQYQSLRGRITYLVSTFCSSHHNCFGRVFFNSSCYAREAYDDSVDLIFTGDLSSDIDDLTILNEIEAHLHRSHQYNAVVVVSDEQQFISDIHSHNMRILGAAKFLNLMIRKVI